MKNVVMKFGGTSVAEADAIRRLIEIVKTQARRSGASPVVVVSAMSRVTDQVLRLAADAARGEREGITPGIDELRQRHVAAAEALVPVGQREPLVQQLEQQIDELRAMLTAIAILREASPRSVDGIASAGELLSSRIVAAALDAAGTSAVWIDARRAIVTDDHYTAASPLTAETAAALPGGYASPRRRTRAGRRRIRQGHARRHCDDARTRRVGLFGVDHRRRKRRAEIRSGPTSTACSPPIPPRRRPTRRSASVLRRSVGARVFRRQGVASEHDSSGGRRRHSVRILNSRRPELPGTTITATPPRSDRPLTALACKRNITVVEVTSTRMLMAHGFRDVCSRCSSGTHRPSTS